MEIELWVVDRSGERIVPLPDANLESVEWVLNRPGSATFSIDPLSEGAREIEGIRREIQIWFDGQLKWWGVPWGLSGNSQEISVTCEGLLSLFNKRFVDRTSLLYTSVDQFSIAWSLLNYAQSEVVEGNRDFNIDAANFTGSGVIRSRDYAREEHENILDALYEFDRSALSRGFDWDIEITPDGGRFWTPYYPLKGSPKPEYAVEWDSEGERNIATFDWSENFLDIATLVYATGGSVTSGDVTFRKEGKYEDVSWSAYWGQMQTIFSEGTQMDETWLEDRARKEVESKREPELTFGMTMARGLELDALHGLEVGDWVPVSVNHGRIQVPGLWQRISSIAWNENDSVTVTFTEEMAA